MEHAELMEQVHVIAQLRREEELVCKAGLDSI